MLALASAVGSAACTGSVATPARPEQLGGADADQPVGGSSSTLCRQTPRTGPAPLRRLTRVEYTHAVRDAFGVDTDVARTFAADERVSGTFASNAEASIATVQLRQYLEAAEQVSARIDVSGLTRCAAAPDDETPCVRALLAGAGRRAYRRPLSAEEEQAYLDAFEALRQADDFQTSVRVLAQALLQSPHFLLHLELDDPERPAVAGSVARLPPYALAARLSFLLWASVPDDELLEAAGDGSLDGAAGLKQQASRMLEDPRAKESIASFHADWLGLQRLEQATRDPALFPEWNAELAADMRAATASFTDYVVRARRGSFRDLMTEPMSFPGALELGLLKDTESLTPDGDGMRLDPTKRAGLLTQPAFLVAHSHSNQSSPVLRGRAIRERLFCQPLADPPPDVVATAPELDTQLTTRERVALHKEVGSSCYGCHHLIDGPGFSLEHFDALGRYRELENGLPIDASFELIQTDVDGKLDGAIELADSIASSTEARACYAKQWFRYALGRAEQAEDGCSIARITDALEDDGAIADLLLALVVSDSFVHKVVEK